MRRQRGFTLIELLVVTAIIGVLAAIAIPQFAGYRQRGFDARARSDLRNVATAEEAYFADTARYYSCTLTGGSGTCQSLPGIVGFLSGGVDLAIANANDAYFTGTSTHPLGSGVTFAWNSTNGGLQ